MELVRMELKGKISVDTGVASFPCLLHGVEGSLEKRPTVQVTICDSVFPPALLFPPTFEKELVGAGQGLYGHALACKSYGKRRQRLPKHPSTYSIHKCRCVFSFAG